jgi:hypothetical protein
MQEKRGEKLQLNIHDCQKPDTIKPGEKKKEVGSKKENEISKNRTCSTQRIERHARVNIRKACKPVSKRWIEVIIQNSSFIC